MAVDGKKQLGKLSSFGVDSPVKVPLLLPVSLKDYRGVFDHVPAGDPAGAKVVFVANVTSCSVKSGSPSRLVVAAQCPNGGDFGFSLFGYVKELEDHAKKIQSGTFFVHGEAVLHNGRVFLNGASLVPQSMAGKLVPVYPGKAGVIGAAKVGERVRSLLEANYRQCASALITDAVGGVVPKPDQLNMAMAFLGVDAPQFKNPIGPEQLQPVLAKAKEVVEQWLRRVHAPEDYFQFSEARRQIEAFASLVMYLDAKNSAGSLGAIPRWAPKLDSLMESIDARSCDLPYNLIPSQWSVVFDIARDLTNGEKPTSRLVSGDVGTGKTVVYGLSVAGALDTGGRVAVLLPSVVLAQQIYDDLVGWWPDLAEKACFVSSNSKARADAQLYVGTTALLNQDLGRIDYVVVDEQQRFSREQREGLLAAGSHLVEVTATCIPRSQALVQYGVMDCSRLTECHVKKSIDTNLYHAHQKMELYRGVQDTLANGGQVLVVYPAKDENSAELQSASEGFELWNNRYKDRCCLATGDMSESELKQVLDDMRNKRKQILISTTVVEVGVNIPSLERVVVIHAERLGLLTLHQIRGRVARHGGKGFCDLYLPKEVGEDSQKRLQVLVDETDGYVVAEKSMELRGFGDLRSKSKNQSGASVGLVFGQEIDVSVMSEVLEWAANLKAA